MLYPNNHTARDAIRNWLKTHYNVAPDYKVRSLVPVSGGLDSVVMLALLLQHTNHEIHVHHVDIRNAENRADAEMLAIGPILEYLSRQYRPFVYTASTYQMMFAPKDRVGPDVSLVMFMLSRVNFAMGNIFDIIWTAHMKGVIPEYNEAAAILAAGHTNHRMKPLWAMPFYNIRKFNLYTAIPPELAAMTWSCRFPTYDGTKAIPCNTCHACDAMRMVREQVEKLTPKKI